jgi:hypothetical protein
VEENLKAFLSVIEPHLPLIGLLLSVVLSLVSVWAKGDLDNFVRETVAAVYRVAIKVAEELKHDGLDWLLSEEGVAYRKALVLDFYSHLPDRLGPVPIGLLKPLLPATTFVDLVEQAFQRVVALAKQALPVEPEPIDPGI